MIGALAVLLGCDLAGEALRRAVHLPIPGPVAGMLLLAAILVLRGRRAPPSGAEAQAATALDRTAEALIANMGLLFVPAGVGVIAQAALLQAEWLPIVAALLGSTLLGLAVSALVLHWTLPRATAAARPPEKARP